VSVLPEKPTLSDLQVDIARLIKERGWEKESASDIFLLMMEEMGELAREIRKLSGAHFNKSKYGESVHAELEGEFADILNYFLDLANHLGVDLERAYRAKQAEVEGRTWS
jgi:NTP pyrophosphatase (non-canonical NTP hydrolase)